MSKAFIFLLMIFCHIVDDFNLQGIMAEMKQKSWWRKNPEYKEMYKFDYIPALLMHSLSWTFFIMLPIMIYYHFNLNFLFMIFFIFNIVIHAWTDHLKANEKFINLCQDQIIHIMQISATFILLVITEWGGI